MRPLLSPDQGRIVRQLVLYLSKVGGNPPSPADVRVESVASQPWASLTFAGERHRLVVSLPGSPVPCVKAGDIELIVPRLIVAVERADWAATGDGAVLTLDLLAIEER